MENTQDTSTEEQGHVSALAIEEPKDKEQGPTTIGATTPNTFTDDEKRLAEKYQVEPKLIRMIAEIVGEHTSEIAEIINLMRGEREQEVEPEQAERQKQPKKATPITALQRWLSKRGYTEKLTAVLLCQLLSKESIYEQEGYCEAHYGNNLIREFEQVVVDASQDEEYLKTADGEEIAVTGMVAALLPMRT